MNQLILIGLRSLWQHRTRTLLLGAAIAAVSALLIALTSLSTGMRTTMLVSATTLSTGHVNVAGFYKVTAGQSAPVVTDAAKVVALVRETVPELDYLTERGRGWAKLVSDTGSMQVGVAGVEIDREAGFAKVLVIQSGALKDLAKKGSIVIFEEQAKKIDAKVGDRLTISSATPRGTNNTIDVTVRAIAQNVGMMSNWNTFVDAATLRDLYQLNDDTDGAIHIYLKDITKVKDVQARLRKAFAEKGWGVMDDDPRAFWMKIQSVNREDWTGQKIDVTTWEDEISFIKWTVDGLTALAVMVTIVLLVIIGVGIMNVMWITIRERTREIGTLRAIGMQRTRVLTMFVIEGFLLGLGGTLAGTSLGFLGSWAINSAHAAVPKAAQLFLMTDHLVMLPTLGWAAFAVIFITAVVTLVSLVPSFLAARLQPVTAMSHLS